MKKNRFFWASAAIAALTLTACADQDEFNQNDVQTAAVENAPGAIQFGTYMGKNVTTRSGSKGIIDTEVLKVTGYGFGVMAFNTGATPWATAKTTTIPNFMYNEKVYWDGGSKWIYDNVKYWPNDFNNGAVDRGEGSTGKNVATGSGSNMHKLSFFAYAPFVDFTKYTPADAADATTLTSVTPTTKQYVTSEETEGIVAATYNEKVGDPYVKYILKDATSTKAVDLLWGLRGNTSGYDLANGATEATIGAYNTDLTKQTVEEKVNFLFKHALAKVGGHDPESATDAGDFKTGLQVILDIDKDGALSGGSKDVKTLVTINDVLIEDKYTYDQRITSGAGTVKSDLKTNGWFDIATGDWADVTISATNGATYTSGTTTTTSSGAQGKLNPDIAEPATSIANTAGTAWTLDGTVREGVVETKAKDVYSADSDVPAIFMIPAPTDGGGANDQTLIVTITYTVRTYDNHLATYTDGTIGSGTWTYAKQKITNAVTIPGGSLDANKYYKILMHLGLTSVKFTATVADWDEVENTDSNNDGNVDDPKDADKEIWLPSNTLSVTGVHDVENAVAEIDMSTATQTVTLPYAVGPHVVAVLNASPSSDPKITLDVSGVTGATVANVNGVVTVTFDAANNTSSIVDHGTFKLTDDNSQATTVTLKQGVGDIVLAASPLLVNATSGQTTVSATINSNALALVAADIKKVEEGSTDVTSTSSILADGKVTVPNNKTTKRKTYTITVGQGDAHDATIDIEQKSCAITVTPDKTTGLSASKGSGSVVDVTVKDAQDTPANVDLTDTDNKTTVTVMQGSTDVTGLCTIEKTDHGVTVMLPANTGAARTFTIKVKVNDGEATTAEITQNAAS